MRFLVLRNHQGLPESNNARDVDILVSPQTEPKSINAIVGELSKRFKANIIWINNRIMAHNIVHDINITILTIIFIHIARIVPYYIFISFMDMENGRERGRGWGIFLNF